MIILFKFRTLLAIRRVRDLCRPLNKVQTTFKKNMSNNFCGPAQDRPLRSADLGRK